MQWQRIENTSLIDREKYVLGHIFVILTYFNVWLSFYFSLIFVGRRLKQKKTLNIET